MAKKQKVHLKTSRWEVLCGTPYRSNVTVFAVDVTCKLCLKKLAAQETTHDRQHGGGE